jgi:hypothetical protein
MVADLTRLIRYTGNGQFEVDLRQFPDSFIPQHFTNNPKSFCAELIRKLEQPVFKCLSDIGIPDFQSHYSFGYFGRFESRTVKYYRML